MTPQAIAKLRRTFIGVAMASFFVVILFMGATSAISNMMTVRGQANATIDAILDAGGRMPNESNYHGGSFHEEANYGLRFFTVSFDKEGNVTDVDVSHVTVFDREAALVAAAVASDPTTITGLGEYENYLYKEGPTEDGSMVVFLDCAIMLANAREVINNTLILVAGALIVTFITIFIFSRWAIKPEVENARRQQEFITNASHELKTPIAVIRANTELTEMISGETEWTQSTMRQVDRLDGLVRDLMTIARGEEKSGNSEVVSQVDVTAVVSKAIESFKGLSQQRGLELSSSLSKGITIPGQEGSIEQLACLLIDNALKYCDEGGRVEVSLSPARLGGGCTLIVSNDYAAGADIDYHRFFERFYREDESHENQSGYGIGLSVAESICEGYRGSIKATWKAGVISFTCVLKGIA